MKYDMPFLMNILDKIVETNLGHSSLSRRLKRIDSSVYRHHVSFFVHLSEWCDGSITITKRKQSFGDGRIRSLDNPIDSVATVKGFGKKQRIR